MYPALCESDGVTCVVGYCMLAGGVLHLEKLQVIDVMGLERFVPDVEDDAAIGSRR